MKTVFIYAGQGSQRPGMGADFYDSYEAYRKISDSISLPFDHHHMMRNGSEEELLQTEIAQPCMAVFAAGVTEILLQNDVYPDASAGLSLGEYGALYAANVWDVSTYVNITSYRGAQMALAAKQLKASMSAILGLAAGEVEDVCRRCASYGFVTVANYNCPGQYVICGEEKAVEKAEEEAKAMGAKRCVRLAVSTPFHTEYLKPAAEKLGEYFEEISFSSPEIPVAMNVTGRLLASEKGLSLTDTLKFLLKKQAMSSVRFEDDLRILLEEGAEEFIEIGPGNALSGFCRKTARAMGKRVKIVSIQTVDDMEKYLERR